MKAKDLAEKLLEDPELEVYIYGADGSLYNDIEVKIFPENIATEGSITATNNSEKEIILLY